MEEGSSDRNVPVWFWVVAVLALLFEAVGCYAYLVDVSRTSENLPIDQQALADVTPWWIFAAYAVAVWVGLLGAVLLLMRRRHASILLLISLIAVVIQFGGVLLVPDLRDAAPPDAFTLPIVITVVAYGIWHFSLLAQRRGWLR